MQFWPVGDLADFLQGIGHPVTVEGRDVIIFSDGATLHALDNLCPHAGARFTRAKLREGRFICPMHGARFDVTTGQCLSQGITRQAVVRHITRIHDGQVQVALSPEPPSLPPV